MAVSGCYALVKYLIMIVNFIFWLAGLAILAVSIWMLVDDTFYLSVTQQTTHYHTGLILLLAIGALTFIVGFLGCCGAMKESTCLLITFFWLLLIILVAEVAAGAWAFYHKEALVESLRDNVKYSVQNEYGEVESRTLTLNAIQNGLQCCGAEGPQDWAHSKYNKKNMNDDSNILSLAVSAAGLKYQIPESCCQNPGSQQCKISASGGVTSYINPEIHSEGCIDKLIDVLNQYMTILIAVGFTIAILEILGLVFSLVLCCAIRNTDRYKA